MTIDSDQDNILHRFWWLYLVAFLTGFSIGGGWEILDFSEWSYAMRHNTLDTSEVISNIVLWSVLRGPGLGFGLAFVVLLVLLVVQHFANKSDESTT